MSYPRKIHPLVVEDEMSATTNYVDIFRHLGDGLQIAPPRFAHCFADAEAALRTDTIFHLLILDLGLPLERRGAAEPGIEPGLRLLDLAADRGDYPIPAVLIVSGRLNQAKLPGLLERLQRFSYGQVINKGIDEETETANAIAAVHRYCDVGIHLKDRKSTLCPTLSPREEDILRRCVLKLDQCLGVDLRWWGTYRTSSSAPVAGRAGLTKVLVGRFILDNGMELSHPSFFKFDPSEYAMFVQRDVAIMDKKLHHVKTVCALTANPRSLLVTQKVGDSSEMPVPLADFLRGKADSVAPHLPNIVRDVVDQLMKLGDCREQQRPTNELLWKHHRTAVLEQVWSQHACAPLGEVPEAHAVSLLRELSGDCDGIWVPIRPCNHGDLHSTNVALDLEGDQVRAYIFDAAGVRGDVSVRDLATLEVTSILHHARSIGGGLAGGCADLYSEFVVPPSGFGAGEGSDLLRNTRTLIAEIRRQGAAAYPALYALMVFDAALIQLGGLAVEQVGNKISDPAEAWLLTAQVAKWYRNVRSPRDAQASGARSGAEKAEVV